MDGTVRGAVPAAARLPRCIDSGRITSALVISTTPLCGPSSSRAAATIARRVDPAAPSSPWPTLARPASNEAARSYSPPPIRPRSRNETSRASELFAQRRKASAENGSTATGFRRRIGIFSDGGMQPFALFAACRPTIANLDLRSGTSPPLLTIIDSSACRNSPPDARRAFGG